MRASTWIAGLLAASLLAGCAAVPEQSPEDPQAAETAPHAPAAGGAEVVPNKVIDLNAVVDDSASRVVCRDELQERSNVILKRCMTVADWERYMRIQAQQAEEFVRQLQGFR